MRMWIWAMATVVLTMLAAGCKSSVVPIEVMDSDSETEIMLGLPTQVRLGIIPRPVLDEIIRTYEAKHPNVRIKVREAAFSPPWGQEEGAFDGLDILISTAERAQRLAEKGMLHDLSSVQPAWDPLLFHVVEATHHDGHVTFLPVVALVSQLGASVPAFEAANMSLPRPDWTHEDFERTLRELAQAEYQPVLSAQPLLRTVMRAHGVELYDGATGRWNLDTPELRTAVMFVARLANEGLLGEDDESARVIANQTPLSNWFDSFVPDGITPIPYPIGPAGRGQTIHLTGAVIFGESAVPGEALHFVRFLVEEGGPEILARHGWRPLIDSDAALDIWRHHAGPEEVDLMEEMMASAPYVVFDEVVGRITFRLSKVRDEHELDRVIAELDQEFNP